MPTHIGAANDAAHLKQPHEVDQANPESTSAELQPGSEPRANRKPADSFPGQNATTDSPRAAKNSPAGNCESRHRRRRPGRGDAIPRHMRGRGQKAFVGFERWTPLDRNAKARIMYLARAKMRRTEPGKAYGEVTAKFLAVLRALLFDFHNAASGKCFPSLERLAQAADCARSTAALAIRSLEAAGILTWMNRLVRVAAERDLFGRSVGRIRVLRTSNAYAFIDPKPDPKPSKSDFASGTPVQDSISNGAKPDPKFEAAIAHAREVSEAKKEALRREQIAKTVPGGAPCPV